MITGIFYQKINNSLSKEVPLGIIPVGRNNIIAKKLYSSENASGDDALSRVKLMMDATYGIVRELTSPLNVIETKNLTDEVIVFLNEILFPVF